jgi:tRNA nucleotidyltransferase/poly(A) polymerase
MDAVRDTGRVVFGEDLGKPLVVDCSAWRGPTLEDDLRHRDFTVDALAVPVAHVQAKVIDVTGGLADLGRRLIRAAYDRSIADDPLRGLRAVRLVAELSSYRFRLERVTEAMLRDHASALAQPAPERVRDELVYILSAEAPDSWLRLMADLDQLSVVLPEVAALRGVHGRDAFGRTLARLRYASDLWRWVDGLAEPWPDQEIPEALEQLRPRLAEHFAAGDSRVRNRGQMWMWAALAQDWDRPAAQTGEEGNGVARPLPSRTHQQLVMDALRRLRFNEAEAQRVATIVLHHLRPLSLVQPGQLPDRRAVHRYFQAVGDAGVEIALLSLAARRAAGESGLDLGLWRWHVALVARLLEDYFARYEAIIAPHPLVDGNDLMEQLGLQPGPWIGHLLAEIAEAQAAGELHSREEALALADRRLRALQQIT